MSNLLRVFSNSRRFLLKPMKKENLETFFLQKQHVQNMCSESKPHRGFKRQRSKEALAKKYKILLNPYAGLTREVYGSLRADFLAAKASGSLNSWSVVNSNSDYGPYFNRMMFELMSDSDLEKWYLEGVDSSASEKVDTNDANTEVELDEVKMK